MYRPMSAEANSLSRDSTSSADIAACSTRRDTAARMRGSAMRRGPAECGWPYPAIRAASAALPLASPM